MTAPPEQLDVRPRKARWVAVVLAVLLVSVFTVVAVLLRSSDTGVYFRVADQAAMVLVGVLLASAALLFARPRVLADADGVVVRNVIGTHRLPWAAVLRVSFPDGAPWARLELPDDEYLAVMAIQATDKDHAVRAVRRLRALHGRYAPVVAPDPAPEPVPDQAPDQPRAADPGPPAGRR